MRVRYGIVALICGAVMINYLDRALLGVALPGLQRELAMQATLAGLLLSAFSWTYFLAQLPAGVLLDRLGVKVTYVTSIALWSAVTLLHGIAGGFRSLFGLRLALGLAEAPCFPANSKIITMWCPRNERARAVGLYTAAEYVGLGFLSPILFWGLSVAGWRSLFVVAGLIGVVYSVVFARRYFDPNKHPTLTDAERDEIAAGGGLVKSPTSARLSWADVRRLLAHRQIVGVCLGQFAVHSTLTFFLTWFPSYLVTERHIVKPRDRFRGRLIRRLIDERGPLVDRVQIVHQQVPALTRPVEIDRPIDEIRHERPVAFANEPEPSGTHHVRLRRGVELHHQAGEQHQHGNERQSHRGERVRAVVRQGSGAGGESHRDHQHHFAGSQAAAPFRQRQRELRMRSVAVDDVAEGQAQMIDERQLEHVTPFEPVTGT